MDMSAALRSFRGKRVFVTGHTGFKGSWLTFLLSEVGADVMGLALPPEGEPNHFELLGLRDRIQHVEADVRDADNLRQKLLSFQPEYVFHLAAQPLVRRSYAEPVATFDVNVMGGVHLLDAVRQCDSVRSLVYITSDKCYENHEWVWGYRETDQLGGHDPYSASKAAAEIVFSAYVRSFFSSRPQLGAASTRAGNVIGGGDWAADRIVPDCIRALQQGQAVRLRNPGATRPWQHVLEPLSGYVLLAAVLRQDPQLFGGAWNFGPTTAEVRTVHDVANAIVKHIGTGRVEVDAQPGGQHEAGLLQLNCDRAHQLLRWYPRWGVDRTLEATASWYAEVLQGKDAAQVTRRQIREYFPELP
jgi:CDP-glucose 4,6-dehydratase